MEAKQVHCFETQQFKDRIIKYIYPEVGWNAAPYFWSGSAAPLIQKEREGVLEIVGALEYFDAPRALAPLYLN